MNYKERKRLPKNFYLGSDVVEIARKLLGKVIVTRINDQITAGMITETEAYAGTIDRASHAFNNRRTKRTETMFGEGGVAYVYLCYGIHHLFNVVTNVQDTPHAVLLRAIEPVEGVDIMLQRRQKEKLTPGLTAGPGAMSQALGITTILDRSDLITGDEVWIEDRGIKINDKDIVAASRVGVAYAKEDALLPYRFYLRENPFVSKAKGL